MVSNDFKVEFIVQGDPKQTNIFEMDAILLWQPNEPNLCKKGNLKSCNRIWKCRKLRPVGYLKLLIENWLVL